MTEMNYTIDDSQWSTAALSLSSGWNMLRINGSNEYINSTQVAVMEPLLGEFWNSSISWTTAVNASTTLTFIGTDIYAFGISGPSQGKFLVALDNVTLGMYTAQSTTTEYQHLLFNAHGLEDGVEHQLTLANTQDGASFAFDYAAVTSVAAFESPEDASAASASAAAASAASASAAAAAAASASLAAILNPNNYTAEQLASLTEVYKFQWNPAAYFVVIFSSLVVAVSCAWVFLLFLRSWLQGRNIRLGGGGRGGVGSVSDGESYLIRREGAKPRPTTRVLSALRGGKISHPVPSEDGYSEGQKRGSGTSLALSGEEVPHGW